VEAGTKIRKKMEPGTVGIFTGQTKERPGFTSFRVKLPDGGHAWWREHQIELAPDRVDRLEAFQAGRYSNREDLQRGLMLARIRGDLTDMFYSMNTSNIDFFPHQFQPVLRFIESPTNRLLIADEVGLGKTIEAMLIWKELQARQQARRLLIVCPAMLREKWRDELSLRFDIAARIAKASDLVHELERTSDSADGFALVCGYEAIRPLRRQGGKPGPRQKLSEQLEQGAADVENPLFDLVIVDEAHYARNPETSTNRLVRLLNDAASALVLLTATPIQLGDENLYQLLHLVDPDRFSDYDIFQRLLMSNAPFVEAYRALSRTPADLKGLESSLAAMAEESTNQDLIRQIRKRLQGANELGPSACISLARTLERASVVSTAMTRSRKREVLKDRVERQAKTIEVKLSPEEKSIYEQVTAAILERASKAGSSQISRLVLITRQRQMASCIPAAIEAWSQNTDMRELLFEDFGIMADDETDDDELDPVLVANNNLPQHAQNFRQQDSKFNKLVELIKKRLGEDPSEKFVVFAYYRATLEYLNKRLLEAGATVFLMHGSVTEAKVDIINDFREWDGPAILLSSEVGSEGIDLQFCSTLINYDLPWNPMRVEQRIGRWTAWARRQRRSSSTTSSCRKRLRIESC
jgi:SNF2 family DNA or RNA helicase